MSGVERGKRRSAVKLALASVFMFAFALFVLPLMYDAACRLFGLNGRNFGGAPAAATEVDASRSVSVEFLGNVYQDTPLVFEAPKPAIRQVHPGQMIEVTYVARNLTDQVLWAQAVHGITPGQYGKHVNVPACFCFQKQKFEPGQTRLLTFGFSVSPQLPSEQSTLSVSYTFFKLENPPEDIP